MFLLRGVVNLSDRSMLWGWVYSLARGTYLTHSRAGVLPLALGVGEKPDMFERDGADFRISFR